MSAHLPSLPEPRPEARGITPWLLAAAAALLLTGLVLRGTAADRTLFAAVNGLGPEGAWLWSALSVTGLGLSAFLIAGAVGPRRPQALAAIVLALLIGGLLVHLCKLAFGAARPLAVLGADGMHLVGIALRNHAMPSGHAAMGFGAAALLLAWRPQGGTLPWRLAASGAALLLALGVAVSRVAVGAHWPSDVLAGAGLGLGAGAVLAGTARGRRMVRALAARMVTRVGSRVVAAALVVAAAAMWVAERDYPAAAGVQAALAAGGLAAALLWWRHHPGHGSLRRRAEAPPWPAAGS